MRFDVALVMKLDVEIHVDLGSLLTSNSRVALGSHDVPLVCSEDRLDERICMIISWG